MSKPVQVLYDARMLGYSGIGTQVEAVLQRLVKRPEVALTLAGHPDTIKKHLPQFEGRIRTFTDPIYSIREQIRFPRPGKNQIIHSPHYNGAIKFLNRSLVVVHDLIHLDSAEFSSPIYRAYASFFLGQVARRAPAIATVSDYSRERMIANFPGCEERIVTIHNGIDHSLFRVPKKSVVDAFRKKHRLKNPFGLCVGIGKKHKNVDFVIRSLKTLWDGGLQLDLCIAGTGGKLPGYLEKALETFEHKERIRVLPFFDKEELPVLYGAADVFIMPSLIEGFGFPLAEAMACGTPVISSRRSSLPEVGGDVPLYFDPESESELREVLLRVLEDKRIRSSMKKEGPVQAKRFTWDDHVQSLVTLYQSVHRKLYTT
ncbi:MAG: glycosyltransferase family 4 protein [Leptospiraceae bacterium]|nr:glycosyltransferase family 4 protein [Leptospiraceae bacterium]